MKGRKRKEIKRYRLEGKMEIKLLQMGRETRIGSREGCRRGQKKKKKLSCVVWMHKLPMINVILTTENMLKLLKRNVYIKAGSP